MAPRPAGAVGAGGMEGASPSPRGRWIHSQYLVLKKKESSATT
eukprot:CAMPEP_0113322344 /NCGR_PEP_ID=MMETSP0010_2-20120614/15543_1 /TAXON_ID=216773 ORGANISM="Corethron hystrix, Strain 308" /NCGR_SAMPLE_ID=MMETSP0010_2 /ASSEMBLY_ACC=CAM_ASM_000155 /LENGTH=42 /DNA_ID=CAMNT_0000180813 /DNA_START=462 /DNA_END=590 /DNA_ORIENTATION=+ /assembly_acc=CAM_ASM_000155